MADPEPPLKPGTAALGCGVLAGGSLVSLLWLGQAFLVPLVADLVGLDLSGGTWAAFSIGVGVVAAVVLFFMTRRAFEQT